MISSETQALGLHIGLMSIGVLFSLFGVAVAWADRGKEGRTGVVDIGVLIVAIGAPLLSFSIAPKPADPNSTWFVFSLAAGLMAGLALAHRILVGVNRAPGWVGLVRAIPLLPWLIVLVVGSALLFWRAGSVVVPSWLR